MVQMFVLSSILLVLPAQAGGRSPSMLGGKPAAKADTAKVDASKTDTGKANTAKAEAAKDPAEALAKYNEMKEKTPKTVAAQSRLAAWCEEHGLKAEAYVHYAEVVRLDPKREAAWRKLGFKKYGNRWMTDAEIAAAEEQKQATRIWLPQLKKIHKDIHGSNGLRKRDQAVAAFEAIRDEKAIPSLYQEFGGSQTDQILLIEALERMDKPLATRVMAMLAVYGRTPDVRRRATELLRNRKSDDYLQQLVGLMVDPVRYEVRPVGGPGSPGVLFVEGETFNVARFYAPPVQPNVVPGPGDIISYDQYGMPSIIRDIGPIGGPAGVPGSKTLAYQREGVIRYSAEQMMLEAQKGAAAAEAQLQGDLSQVKAVNNARRHFNDLVISVASYASGKSVGDDPKDWRKAVGLERKSGDKPEKPTITELVPMAYRPQFAQLGFSVKVFVDT